MKKFLPAIFFLTVSSLLILIWFRDGRIFAGGDVGFQTFNPGRVFENTRFVWWDSTAPGSPIPQGLTAIPFQFSLALLQLLGFPPVALQATLFLVLLFAMGFGMYLFLAERFKTESRLYPLLGGLFYIFNPYMMIQVWHRFIHTTIILAAALPFLAIFWDKWIRHGKLKYLTFFLISSFLAVYVFGTYAFVVTVWIFLTLLAIPNLLPWSGRKLFFEIGARFLFGFIIWILLNCWWILPVVKISPALLSVQHKSADNLTNLIMISSQAILPYSIQLINPFYPFYQAEFGDIYKNPLFQVIPWIFVAVILVGLMYSFKTKVFSLFGIFFLLAIFLAKGTAPPFGALYIFGFKNFFALGVLRNPFEKTGLILVFFATVLFVLGIHRLKNKAVLIIALASVLIFSWPMLLGRVFGSINKRGDVEVPQSYKLADVWLKGQRTAGIADGNILHLPLTRGEAVSYNWEFGYNGLESSDQFFTTYPSVSRGFNIQRVDDSLTALSLIFHGSFYEDNNKILRLLQAFNIRFIVLHKDLNWLGADVYDPFEVEKILEKLTFIEKKAEFKDLTLYQIPDRFFGPKIEFNNKITYVYPPTANMTILPWLGGLENNFISPVDDVKKDEIMSQSEEILIFPEKISTDSNLSRYYDFLVNIAGQYELLADRQFEDANISIDSKIFKGKLIGNLVSFEAIDLEQGVNQIKVSTPPPISLIGSEAVQLNAFQDSTDAKEFPLGQTFGNDVYQLSFEAVIPVNARFNLEIIQDTDAEDNGQKLPRISFQIPGSQTIGWQAYKLELPPLSVVTREAKIRSTVKSGEVLIRNLSAVRIFGDSLFLRSIRINDEYAPAGSVNFTKVSPVEYEGVLNVTKAGFLFFKETYHQGWNLQMIKNNNATKVKEHYLGYLYGNAWYIDSPGEYRFKIIFEPQNNLYLGILLGGFTVVGLGIYGVWFRRNKKDEK